MMDKISTVMQIPTTHPQQQTCYVADHQLPSAIFIPGTAQMARGGAGDANFVQHVFYYDSLIPCKYSLFFVRSETFTTVSKSWCKKEASLSITKCRPPPWR